MDNFQLPCNLSVFLRFQISTWKVLCVMSVVACVLTFATSVIGAISSCNDWVLCVDIAVKLFPFECSLFYLSVFYVIFF